MKYSKIINGYLYEKAKKGHETNLTASLIQIFYSF